jgi:hypothetical protein
MPGTNRRFPQPSCVEETDACDANGQALACVYFEDERKWKCWLIVNHLEN